MTTQPLSPREIETLAAYCRTHSYKEVAEQLGISTGTVKAHLQAACLKLDTPGDSWRACEVARDLGLLRAALTSP